VQATILYGAGSNRRTLQIFIRPKAGTDQELLT